MLAGFEEDSYKKADEIDELKKLEELNLVKAETDAALAELEKVLEEANT